MTKTEDPKEQVQVPSQVPSLPLRTCGSCYTCCVWLGIEELKKHTGQSCRYLTGINGPTQRCGIYPTRPKACQIYKCLWLEGLGPDAARPDKSGLLLTPYESEDNDNSPFSVTIIVINPSLAGTINTGYLGQFIEALLILGCNEIRVTNHKDMTVVHFRNGEIRQGKLLKSKTFEEFVCETYDPPIGRYKTFDDQVSAEKWKQENPEGKIFL